MSSFVEKIAMSGYAPYVWSSFGIVIGALVVLYWLSKRRLKKALTQAEKLQILKEYQR